MPDKIKYIYIYIHKYEIDPHISTTPKYKMFECAGYVQRLYDQCIHKIALQGKIFGNKAIGKSKRQ